VRINVTKSFLPPIEEYKSYLNKIWETSWLTNNGPLLIELEEKLKELLAIDNLLFVGNGTIAIQLALKALELKGEIITTPYSYCATTTAILWENCTPIFVDINEHDLNLNPALIEDKITANTSAILATHVYGNPCDVNAMDALSEKYNIPIIYDAAHAFGATLNGKSLLNYGDISTCSFHSTKVFHTIEGGAVISKRESVINKIALLRSFGHRNDDYKTIGINGKNSEFHAAMGLTNLPYIKTIIEQRKAVSEIYDSILNFNKIVRPFSKDIEFSYNYAYYPIILESKEALLKVERILQENDIFPRRYFYPSLNTLDYIENKVVCPISESVASRVLSLPLYPDLDHEIVKQISNLINQVI
jgi:dTDP-4-amino-4,6-dideoxygalactose transaminase